MLYLFLSKAKKSILMENKIIGKKSKTPSTSWSPVAKWYDETVELEGSYQRELILPNLLRLMEIKNDERILDLACGQGFFSRAFAGAGAEVIGADISKDLIKIAAEKSEKEILYHIAPAHSLPFLANQSIDKTALVLALQNIEPLEETLKECARVLAQNGRLFIVLNHPAFRIPRGSSWGFDEETKTQYRRIDRYLSNSKEKILMNPGLNATKERVGSTNSANEFVLSEEKETYTFSFHRPLQTYAKALAKAGFLISRMEEWNSHKKSQPGPRAEAENRARKEIPLFLAIEAQKPLWLKHKVVLA